MTRPLNIFRLNLALFAAVLSLSAFTQPQFARADELREIWLPDETGFRDIDLTITSIAMSPDSITVVGEGLFRGERVGLRVSVPADDPGLLSSAPNGIQFDSMGAESDQLLEAFTDLYGLSPQKRKFIGHLSAPAVSLGGEGRRMEFKVFFNTDSRDLYAEFFVNVDIPAKRLELHEKDSDYRRNVVAALSAPVP